MAEFVDTVKDDTSLVVHESVETIKEGKSKADLGGGVRRAVSGLVDNITTSIATDSSGAPSSRRRSKRPDQPFDRAQVGAGGSTASRHTPCTLNKTKQSHPACRRRY